MERERSRGTLSSGDYMTEREHDKEQTVENVAKEHTIKIKTYHGGDEIVCQCGDFIDSRTLKMENWVDMQGKVHQELNHTITITGKCIKGHSVEFLI